MTENKYYGRVYKIISDHTHEIYIGSTTRPLNLRFTRHKRDLKSSNRITTRSEICKHQDARIELLHEGFFNNRTELHKMERYYITNAKDCGNQVIPARTRKERDCDNRQRIAEYSKQYKQQNSEHINIDKQTATT